jgi:hypothetical protein
MPAWIGIAELQSDVMMPQGPVAPIRPVGAYILPSGRMIGCITE